MGTIELMGIFRDAILTAFKIAAPILIVSLIVGLIIAIFQAATSINEQTLTFVPKLIAISVILVLAGSWMLEETVALFYRIFEFIAMNV